MNVSTQYSLLPFNNNAADFRGFQPRVSYPLSSPEDVSARSSGDSSRQAAQGPGQYKYYVLSGESDQVYTRHRQTQSLYAYMKGSVVDLYV
jgi:hypothetical protein